MNYHNQVLDLPPDPRNLWQFVARVTSEVIWGTRWRLRSQIARLKRGLFHLGLMNSFTLQDARTLGEVAFPQRTWRISENPGSALQEDILSWMHEAVMRSPSPWGYDEQMIVVRIFRGYELIAQHARVVDRYGWRKGGREETAAWLRGGLDRASAKADCELRAAVYGHGRMLAAYNMRPA